MKKYFYMTIFGVMLALLAITFYVQVKTLGAGNNYQWYLLAVIVVVGIGSFYISKRMKEENWFKNQQKAIRTKKKKK